MTTPDEESCVAYANAESAISTALRDLPEMPSLEALSHLVAGSMCHDRDGQIWERGKMLQRQLGTDRVPMVAEYEYAAGLWHMIREMLRRQGGSEEENLRPVQAAEDCVGT
jgi:hypothetical protein